VQRALLST